MPPIYDTSDEAQLLTGMRLARAAVGRGDLVIIPTDTVYGIAADAFDPAAVARLVAAKGRTRAVPPPVLVPGIGALEALASVVPPQVHDLLREFWPGGLTVILPAQPSLDWDLGDTMGTVALRMPDHRIALELLSETGPLAVSSANLHGRPAATTAQEAHSAFGDAVSVVLDAGASGSIPSTIVDATGLQTEGGRLRIVRNGVVARDEIVRVVGAGACE